MKADFHLHFYTRIFFAVAVGAMALFLWQKSIQTEALLHPELYIRGWAWSPIAGWISLNCNNDFNFDGILENHCSDNPPYSNYGLYLTQAGAANTIQGCAWAGQPVDGVSASSALGWICFSDPPPDGPGVDVYLTYNFINPSDPTRPWPSIEKLDEPPMAAYYDELITGLGYSIPNDGSDPDYPQPGDPLDGCFNCRVENIYACGNSPQVLYPRDPTCAGTCQEGYSCILVDQENYCDNCIEYQYYPGICSHNGADCRIDADCGAGNTCENLSTCSNKVWQRCTDISDCGSLAGYCLIESNHACNDDGDCDAYEGDSCVPNVCQERVIGALHRAIGGFNCRACTIDNFDNTCDLNSYGYNRNRCEDCVLVSSNPSVSVDSQYGQDDEARLCGWGYNEEMGWFWFSPRVASSTKPYISVEGGGIYARESIYSPYAPPLGRYNASYLIESGGHITNFISSSTLSGLYYGELKNRPLVDFFSPSGGKYRNILGAIDYTGLITPYANDRNKYGSEVLIFDDSSELSALAAFINDLTVLDGKVFYVPTAAPGLGYATIGSVGVDITLDNEEGGLASGVIIVNTNLILNTNVRYDDTGADISNLKEINSLVWIVRGDLIVDSAVTNLAGTFIILGTGSSCDGPSPVEGCGRFISCDPARGACNRQLVVDGSVLARRFELTRDYYDNEAPAELFINNGRLRANPPPGLSDFGQLLPRFLER